MSSGQHTPRRSPSLRDLSRQDLRAVLSHDQQRTADNRPVPYVGRIGRDRHLVRNPGSDVVYSVGGPAYSFKPGTIVLLGSNTGRPGESIIALPSPAQRGASAYPESRFGGSIEFPSADELPVFNPIVHEYWGIYYDASAQNLHCWNYNGNGDFVEVVDERSANLVDTRNAPSWKSYCVAMHLNGDAIEWPYSTDVSPFPRSGFRWLPLSGTINQFSSTLDPDSEKTGDWHGRFSGVRVGNRFYLSQLSTFVTAGNLSWTDVTDSASLRGVKVITVPSFSDTLAFDTGFSSGWIPAGNSIIMEIGNTSTGEITGILVVDTVTKVSTLHQPFGGGIGKFPVSSAFTHASWSCGVDIGGGRGLFLRKLSGGEWCAVIRSSDGTNDSNHWQDSSGVLTALATGTAPIQVRMTGQEAVAYPFDDGSGHNKIVRTDVGQTGLNPISYIVPVAKGPNGQYPHAMIPKD